MNPITRIEGGGARRFTATYSSFPSGAPWFILTTGSASTVIATGTATQVASTTTYEVFYTFPESRTFYAFTFVASFTTGLDVARDMVQIIKTTP